MIFPCSRCGLCCRKLKGIPGLSEYDRGDGVCRYLENNLCKIYEKRPDICNVETMYRLFFRDAISKQDFFLVNMQCCEEYKSKIPSGIKVPELL
jgi:Fe-S-cluster containining protein